MSSIDTSNLTVLIPRRTRDELDRGTDALAAQLRASVDSLPVFKRLLGGVDLRNADEDAGKAWLRTVLDGLNTQSPQENAHVVA